MKRKIRFDIRTAQRIWINLHQHLYCLEWGPSANCSVDRELAPNELPPLVSTFYPCLGLIFRCTRYLAIVSGKWRKGECPCLEEIVGAIPVALLNSIKQWCRCYVIGRKSSPFKCVTDARYSSSISSTGPPW